LTSEYKEITERDAGAERICELWKAVGFNINRPNWELAPGGALGGAAAAGAPGNAQAAEPIPQYDEGGTVERTGLAWSMPAKRSSAQAPRSDSAAAAEIAAHEATFPAVPATAAQPPLTLGGAIDYTQRFITQQDTQALTDAGQKIQALLMPRVIRYQRRGPLAPQPNRGSCASAAGAVGCGRRRSLDSSCFPGLWRPPAPCRRQSCRATPSASA
jgi:hypothetical protein